MNTEQTSKNIFMHIKIDTYKNILELRFAVFEHLLSKNSDQKIAITLFFITVTFFSMFVAIQ